MAISLKTRKMLWGRAANRCARKNCRIELVIDSTETDDESLIGEECHIVAETLSGPRGRSELTPEERDRYSNLILMCAVHHKQIDDQPNHYTVEYLHQLKAEHEAWVRESLEGYDPAKQRHDEYYADLTQEFCDRVDIDNWKQWASWVFASGYPRIPLGIHKCLEKLRDWLLSRFWPRRYPELEASLQNFRLVVQDFLNVFAEHSEPFGDDMLATKKFYQIGEWDPERYDRLSREHDFHVDLVQDLMLELTRAANYVCDKVRESLFPTFRLKEGVLLVMAGPYMDLTYHTIRTEYSGAERTKRPYPGLEKFKSIRGQRDHCIGHGTQPEMKPHNRGVDHTGDPPAPPSGHH